MTNISKSIAAYLAEKGIVSGILNDAFYDDTSEGVIARHDPGSAREHSYIDGSAEGAVSISFYGRYKDAYTARATLNSIIEAPDNAQIEDEGDNLTISTEAVSLPQYISTDEKGFTLYTAGIRAEYERSAQE